MRVQNNPIIRFLVNNFIDSSYCVGYRFSDVSFWNETHSKFEILKPSLRYWYADPIPFKYEDRFYVFMERYDCFSRIGDIVVVPVTRNGKLGKAKVVISRKTHLSFPIIIPFNGQYYMLPETSATRSIDIYKMKDSPYQWEHHHSLKLEEEIVDVAWFIDDRGILLLGGIPDKNSPMRVRRQIIRLSHMENTKKIECTIGYTDKNASLKTRNAGALFKENNHLYRVVQESTDRIYGLALILNKISELSESRIKENSIKRKTVENIDVHLNRCFYKKIGLHTYGCCKGFEVIDISVAKVSFLPVLTKLNLHTKYLQHQKKLSALRFF